ncbi:MAG: hypothetical protein O7C75_18755 [Verrucomicrobia bacterium]|nr:hypothetical protein [Verrucomicrobiota bacterium]
MKILLFAALFSFSGSVFLSGQAFVGSFYAPDHEDGMLLTLKEENGLFSGTLRAEGEIYQVECKLEDGRLVGQVLGKPIQVMVHQDGPLLNLTLVDLKWGALPDDSTARSYIMQMQGESSSAAANYVQSGEGGEEIVVFNGQVLSRKQLEDFNRRYNRYPRPGNYWYDPRSGLYGAVGFDAYGYMHPGHDYGPLQSNVSRGSSRYFINNRRLSKKEALIWRQLMGRELAPGNYWFDSTGNFGKDGKSDHMFNLFNLGNIYQDPSGLEENFWAAQFGRGRRGIRNRGGFISVPGFGSERYGFTVP